MRLLAIVAAALITTGIAATPAVAQPRGWHGEQHRGWHGGGHRRCQWVQRHHHRERRCW
jgi:Spy/CpxP family protein refolding chaperone